MKKFIKVDITKLDEIGKNKIYYNLGTEIIEIHCFINQKISNKIDRVYRCGLNFFVPKEFEGTDNDNFCDNCFLIKNVI